MASATIRMFRLHLVVKATPLVGVQKRSGVVDIVVFQWAPTAFLSLPRLRKSRLFDKSRRGRHDEIAGILLK
jgi:hypothetical protein